MEQLDECPTCDKCGAPVTTGFMVFICPHGEACHFMPDDERSRAFIREQRPYWKHGVAVVPADQLSVERTGHLSVTSVQP